MTAIGYNSIGANEQFTAKMLDANFKAISEYSKNVELQMFQLTGMIDALAKRPNEVIVKLPKNRKLLIFAAGVAAGVYIYKHRRKIEVALENANEGAKQRFTPPAKDAEWNTKNPGETPGETDTNPSDSTI